MRRGSKRNRLLDYWLGIPLLNTLATLRKTCQRRQWPARVTRVGVMCSPALGDTLLFSGVVQDLRTHFDHSDSGTATPVEIVHFCMKQNLAAAELLPGIDRRVLINLTQPRQTVRKMRAEGLDVFLDFSSWQRLTAFYSMMAGARFTVGFQTAGQHRGRGYDVTVEHRNDQHEVENFRAIVRAAGMVDAAEPRLDVPLVLAEPLIEEKDIVVLHPWAAGLKNWLREWPEEHWVELAGKISGSETIFAVTGGPADMERSAPMVERLSVAGLRAVAYVSPDGFCSLAHLLLRARVVVSVNTGVMHLAAVLGAPTVSLNGPTAAHRWGPRGRCVAGVEPADGSGGYLNLGFEFAGHPEDAMEKILVEDVVKTVNTLVSSCGGALAPRPSNADSEATDEKGRVLWKG